MEDFIGFDDEESDVFVEDPETTTKKRKIDTTKKIIKKTATKAVTKKARKSPRRGTGPVVENWGEYLDKDPTLLEIQEMVDSVNATNSIKQKLESLANFPHCAKALLYVNNPMWVYNITSEKLEKDKSKFIDYRRLGKPSRNIFHLMDMLRDRVVTGNSAMSTVLWFIAENKRHKSLIYMMLDRNLKIRCNSLSINKVFPDLIPIFAVALAEKYDEKMASKIVFENENWMCSRKFDGGRVVIYFDENGKITFYSREGNEFTTLGVVEKTLKPLGLKVIIDRILNVNKSVVMDCEGCILNPDGTENFKLLISELKKKCGEIKNPRMYVFDMLSTKEFHAGYSDRPYAERYEQLVETLGSSCEPVLTVTEQVKVENMEHMEQLNNLVSEEGWEGLIIRKAEAPYQAKRTKDMLKVKKFEREEFVVTGIQKGKMRIVQNGEQKEIVTMSNVIVELEGNTVSVGSGFSLEERNMYMKHPEKIVGKTISVQFFERTCNSEGKLSLRFPTFKGVYGETRDI